ncbi:MAG TPA: thioredoxin-dependent thiol peroxidase [Thermaerobacter sp.]
MPKVGDTAPDFTLLDHRGEAVRLSDFRGRKVVLYFYPKDDTPGCTREACSFRDDHSRLQEAGAVVLGISPDPVESHVRFRDKYGLPFPLLSDPDHQVAEAYGVWKEKRMYGRTYWGIERTTFVIDEEGRVLAVIRGVKPEEHPRRALKALGVA